MVWRQNPDGLMPFVALPRASTGHAFALNQTINYRFQDSLVQDPKREARSLKVLQVMPPGKHFGPLRATSIDLDTWDFVRFSRYCQTTTVIADKVDTAFDGVNLSYYPADSWKSIRSAVEHVARVATDGDVDVIVVQQRLPLAARIARLVPRSRVVLHTHNFQKHFTDRSMIARALRRGYRRRLYHELDGIIHVSEACARDFEGSWPELRLPCFAVGNGLDFSEWSPRSERAREILCVARFAPEKGVLEAAQAIARTLPKFPAWRARFILSEVARHPRYWVEFNHALSGLEGQVAIETDRPFAEVKRAYEQAAVALVPSKWIEPFGRTALEAHAGGAALISSGSGGLSEISGETALMLPKVSSEAIEEALQGLLTDDARRNQLARAGAERARALFDIRAQAAAMDQFLEGIAVPKTGERHV